VWNTIRKVPLGKTITYKEIAEHIGKPKAVRAVASAVGANPIAYIVPCHRVVRQDGAPNGYRWGLPLKEKLLLKEYFLTHPMEIVLS
jgi:AraC family transcriptional regulator of adaptative response/methylated-DNA-[protein]-cysteine methyltransferase